MAPEAIKAKESQLFTAVISTINNRKRRDDYETSSLGCGISLIEILSRESCSASAEPGTWAARQRLVNSLISWLLGRKRKQPSRSTRSGRLVRISTSNCPTHDAATPPSVVAEAYAAAELELGEHISTRLDMKLEVKGAVGRPAPTPTSAPCASRLRG